MGLLTGNPLWAGLLEAADPILKVLREKGYQAYIVGGGVRDVLLGLSPKDADVLTNAPCDTLENLFPGNRVKNVGRAFRVCLVNGVEVASCRAGALSFQDDNQPGPQGARPDKKGRNRILFPEADLGLRDLTINSMAWDPFKGELVDPHGGRQDLKQKRISFTRNPRERILEDPLRMVRACRFAALYGFSLEKGSFDAIVEHAALVKEKVPGDRIYLELIKAMAMEKPSRFFNLLRETSLLTHILPCLDRCYGLDGGPHHGETVFDHCLLVGDALSPRSPILRMAGYLHDVGKYDAAVLKEEGLSFPGHEACVDALESNLVNLRFSRDEISEILSLVRAHMRPLNDRSTPKAVRRLLAMLDGYGLPFRNFLRMRIADKKGNLAKSPYTLADIRIRLEKIQKELARKTALNINDLNITGQEIMTILNLDTGPEVGQVKKQLFEMVLEDPSLNKAESLSRLVLTLDKKQGSGL